jgi:DNA polymerase-3 subunit epsilon
VHDALHQLLAFIGSRPLVGWCLAFDIAMINRYLVPQFGFALPNRRVELTQLYQRHLRRTKPDLAPDLRFEAMADALQVPVAERHSALGDAVMSALMYVRLQRQTEGE